MKPNIFDIATKELSQDAFITWLLRFGDESCKKEDEQLNLCAKEFITALVKSQYPDFCDEIRTVQADRQWENIDVWSEVNSEYFIIIEDKTNTSEHSKQLERYKKIASSHCLQKGYKLVCIYIKTGNESLADLQKIIKKGFSVFDRKSILEILSKYNNIKNNIFSDYLERLSRLEEKNNRFDKIDISEWTGNDWQGFYQFVERNLEMNDINWGLANNPNGGFWYCCFSWLDWKYNSTVYIQLEQDKARLCFKVKIDEDNKAHSGSKVRNELYKIIISEAKKHNYLEIKKPNKFGSGKYMTFAIIEQPHWFGDIRLNKEDVLKNLLKYSSFLHKVIQENKIQ